jgi:hypothetical protein
MDFGEARHPRLVANHQRIVFDFGAARSVRKASVRV